MSARSEFPSREIMGCTATDQLNRTTVWTKLVLPGKDGLLNS